MADQQNSLAVISSGDNAVSLVQQPTSDYRLLRRSASKISRHDFANDFVFGAATSAYQVEGAYAEGGKSLSNWDAFTLRTPGKIDDGSNGCVSTDQYHRYQEDVILMKKLGFDAYRISIAWSRVLPGGRLSTGKSVEGIKYYNDLIDFCLAQGIEPYVTIFHFDLPQCLEDEYGGFLSRQILKDFVEFAGLCFWEFGDRVKYWITVNEALTFVSQGYVNGSFPPAHGVGSLVPTAGLRHDQAAGRYVSSKTGRLNSDTLIEPYIVGHYVILAHALAVDVYRRNFQAVQGGKIGMTNLVTWYEPLNEGDPQDLEAVLRAIDFSMGWFVEPLVTGHYPESMRKLVGDRLPKFTEEEEILVKGSYDFLGLNYYTARYAQNDPSPKFNSDSPFSVDMQVKVSTDRDGIPMGPMASGSNYVMIVPYGIQKILAYAKNKYQDPLIYITENGVSELNNTSLSVSEALVDDTRVRYLQDHLYYISKAYQDDNVRVKGYFLWSILDNFEWANGYTARFGIVYVDFVNGLSRYPKKSAIWMMNFLNQKLIIGTRKRPHADDQDQAEDEGLQKRFK